MKKTIYHDAFLNFGKYKSKAVAAILFSDPGYFLWLKDSETYNLDDEVQRGVNEWADRNLAEARRITASAQRAAYERGAARERGNTEASIDGLNGLIDLIDKLGPVAPPVPEVRPAAWGAWG